MVLLKLPDEILLHILGFMDSQTLVKCRRIDRKFYRLLRDPALLRSRPHQIIDGHHYLNEEIYTKGSLNSELLTKVIKNNKVDLPWLVERTTKIIREAGLTAIGWTMMQTGAIAAIREVACECTAGGIAQSFSPTYRENLWDHITRISRDTDWCQSVDTINAGWTAMETQDDVYTNLYIDTEPLAMEYIDVAEVKQILLELELDELGLNAVPDQEQRAQRAYQVTECLMLLGINKEFCERIVREQMDSDPSSMPLDPTILSENCWYQQFLGLYPNQQSPSPDHQ